MKWQSYFDRLLERNLQCILWNMHTILCYFSVVTWWHQMEAFSTLLVICAENSPLTSEFPAQRLVTRSFDVFFNLGLNKRLSKQWQGWWFAMPSCPLWCHCDVYLKLQVSRVRDLPISFKVVSLVLGPSASEVTLKDLGEIERAAIKHKWMV